MKKRFRSIKIYAAAFICTTICAIIVKAVFLGIRSVIDYIGMSFWDWCIFWIGVCVVFNLLTQFIDYFETKIK